MEAVDAAKETKEDTKMKTMSEKEIGLRNELAALGTKRAFCTKRSEENKVIKAMNAVTKKINDLHNQEMCDAFNAKMEAEKIAYPEGWQQVEAGVTN
jgi:hypothetical protein